VSVVLIAEDVASIVSAMSKVLAQTWNEKASSGHAPPERKNPACIVR